MLSCKESTRLLSQAQDRQLSLPERLQLEMHLALCKGCRYYKGQLNFLRAACRRYVDQSGRPGD